ncbi:hypothetical protein [Candidimonas sp. SYP-B2681]|nr:hypothetical protein [Candidimonas sp. SYP-B2681]
MLYLVCTGLVVAPESLVGVSGAGMLGAGGGVVSDSSGGGGGGMYNGPL